MVITFTQKKKTQKYLVVVLVIIIVAIAFVFTSGLLEKEEDFFIEEPTVTQGRPKISINFQVLRNPVFKKLTEPFPDLPSLPPTGEVGREIPFLPYD